MKKINIQKLLIFVGMMILNFTTNAQVVTHPTKRSAPEFHYDNEEIKKSVSNIADLLTENRVTVSRLKSEKKYEQWGSGKNITVLEDRIEFIKNEEKSILYFKDINRNYEYSYTGIDNVTGVRFGGFELKISGAGNNRKLVDELKFLFGENQKLEQKSQLNLFEPVAAEYRALKVKPPVSEEQRKFIVQANAFNEKKMFNEAISLYEQAIGVDQTAYPAAYSNLALLSAQIKRYNDAIYHMKKYLLLVPDAPDARGAQDKIYEWEALITK